jgi:hypothetical protein
MTRKSIANYAYLCRTPTRWHRRAEEMRTLAEEAQDSAVRRMMLRIAAKYERIAESAEDHAAQDSIMFQSAKVQVISESPPKGPATPSGGGGGRPPGRNRRGMMDCCASVG